MVSICPIQVPVKKGVTGLFILAVTPFLFAANVYAAESSRNLVEVESLSSDASSQAPGGTMAGAGETIEYRPPIEEESASSNRGFETQYQLQVLQQEVQQLRGLVEELSYQLRRMQSTQEDRYLELDGRFQNLQEQINSGAVTSTGSPFETSDPASPAAVAGVVTSSEASEDELYGTALQLIRNRQYDQAIAQLDALIEQYPEGALAANAYYWLGEVYAAKPEPEYENARQALEQVIQFFPASNKVPDAGFKLGKVYHLMGDCDRAQELLTQVMQENSGKSVAKLADTYLRDKVDCGS